MQDNDFISAKILLSVKVFTLFNFSAMLGMYNEIVYSIGVTATSIFAIYNLILLHKKNKNPKT